MDISSAGLQNIQGYSNPALSSPIRISSVGTIPPRITDISPNRNFNNFPLTQRNNYIVPSVVNDLPSPRNLEMPISPVLNSANINQQYLVNSLEDDILTRLKKYNYKPIETINIRTMMSKEAKYIKAIDQRGHYVAIELDLDSNILVQPSDLTTSESVEVVSTIPQSVRMGLLAAAGKSVSGILTECKNGICISSNNERGKPQESFLTIIEKPTDRSLLSTDSILAIPIIKLTDIIENPTLSLEITTKSTESLINASTMTFYQDIRTTNDTLRDFVDKSDKLLQSMQTNMNTIIISLSNYERLRSQYDVNIVPQNIKDNVVSNITNHINIISKNLNAGKRLESIRNELNILTQDMISIKTITDLQIKK